MPSLPLLMSLWFAHPAVGITLAACSRCRVWGEVRSEGPLWHLVPAKRFELRHTPYCSLDPQTISHLVLVSPHLEH